MYALTADITIGAYRFRAVHRVRIVKSIYSFVDTAIIEIPASARLKKAGDPQTQSVETAKQFQEGDKVSINLGYDGKLMNEFTGFVKRVNFTMPCQIECEGYSWQLRKDKITKLYKSTTIKEVLELITAGTDIKISPDIQDTTIAPFRIDAKNGTEVLDMLKKEAFQTVYFIGDTLYVGLEELAQIDKSATYKLGWNTINDDNLKYRRPEDVKVQVNITYKDKKGKAKHKTVGQAGGITTGISYGYAADEFEMVKRAEQEAQKFRYAGYEGKVLAFLIPYAQPGYKADIIDEKYPERSGSYILESTEVDFGMSGARRLVGIGKTINKQ